jgi:pimeloyl-ACP methyl ester carboxylesterase
MIQTAQAAADAGVRGNRIGGAVKRRTAFLLLMSAAPCVMGDGAFAVGGPRERTDGRVPSSDGVEIAYTAHGTGDPALVFIHGGLADHSFWENQLSTLAGKFRVVALDLGGHGASGRGRTAWTISAWAQDVRAVVDRLGLRRAVLIGNSMAGPVALEAAALLKGRVIGVVGVDTLHDATAREDPEKFHARAAAFRKDFAGSCRALVDSLFHPGTQKKLHARAEKRMCAMPPEIVAGMMDGFAHYDLEAAFRKAGVPIRAINGDLFPTRIESNRAVTPDFDAVIMKGCGHYPMLERPVEFNRLLVEIVRQLGARAAGPADAK